MPLGGLCLALMLCRAFAGDSYDSGTEQKGAIA
jgi:hypothetical protein